MMPIRDDQFCRSWSPWWPSPSGGGSSARGTTIGELEDWNVGQAARCMFVSHLGACRRDAIDVGTVGSGLRRYRRRRRQNCAQAPVLSDRLGDHENIWMAQFPGGKVMAMSCLKIKVIRLLLLGKRRCKPLSLASNDCPLVLVWFLIQSPHARSAASPGDGGSSVSVCKGIKLGY